jgi:hypothetical protein
MHIMTAHVRGFMLAGFLAVVVLAMAPATTFAGSASEPILELVPGSGGAVGFGFGVSPLRWEPGPGVPVNPGAQAGERAGDFDTHGRAISFDLKLKWPGADTTTALEPYLALGPALFVLEPDYVGRLSATRVDPTVRVGAKVGAGLNWRLGRDTTLFGAYEVMRANQGGFSAIGAHVPGDAGINGYDLTYGVRFRY